MTEDDRPVEDVLAHLTVEQKAALTSGSDFWHTQPIEDAGVGAIMLTDGPTGLRKQAGDPGLSLGLAESVPATCFPVAASLGSTWDVDLVQRVAAAIAREARAEGVSVVLAPGINIKRSPLCGRNFEYLSEDPYLSGELGLAFVRGLQSEGVGASVKHFAANNAETDRMRVSVDVDERTLHEIYLAAFERVVTAGDPWTVMASYNRINGTYATENAWLLREVLRDTWGYDGVVVSDWGAVHDRVAALRAGTDLTMPPFGDDAAVVDAVRDGTLDESVLDEAVRRVLALVDRAGAADGRDDADPPDHAAAHTLAREAAAAGAVLLKNERVGGVPVLPLAESAPVLVVGELARTPRFQGAGSSQVTPTRVDVPLDALREAMGEGLAFEPGYTLGGTPDQDRGLRAAAVEAAQGDRTIVCFLGLPDSDESEGYDRTNLDLPPGQMELVQELAVVSTRVVVVLANGGIVAPVAWSRDVPVVLEMWLGGQAAGSAVADLLLGRSEPTGRLAETIPFRLEDTPAYLDFPGHLGHSRYGEGVFVGYRYYDVKRIPPAYPFGHGLGYTTFAQSDLTVEVTGEGDDVRAMVAVTVTNTGSRRGTEVVQVYVSDLSAPVARPERELKGFARVTLDAGASERIDLELGPRAFAYWHPVLRRWVVEPGTFTVSIGASSADLRRSVTVTVGGEELRRPLAADSTLAEWSADPAGARLLTRAFGDAAARSAVAEQPMAAQIPLSVLAGLAGIPRSTVDALAEEAASQQGPPGDAVSPGPH
ncbi:glycoside hydrolase family 3 C-terminal domain-containing protein [Mumia sp. zg.B21]|uniref:glycoside hydrolase family 3 N-terminal domain-containing protein n=1 Tax=Mumia sp. zg.B21 TaxID=2855447 RepID=UPI001C6EBD29|nr:glycoside hydrolase family 3 N-terminal domain-containing protein [Mumia sp. zg.B21]MBW9209729.1 glycoside hydrolase family 3 C-terminal domain-containing protein [Mumia sp. zg.B21]